MSTTKTVATIATLVGGVVLAATSASAALMLPTQSCAYTFSTNMRVGSRSEEVRNLQKVLNMYPQTQVAASGVGSMGMETNYFGPATRNAVNKFQELNAQDILSPIGATRGTGNVYSMTRAVLNQVCKGSTSNNGNNNGGTTPVVNGSVMVSLTTNQPSQVIVSGQAAAKLADFTFTGNGNVNMVKLMRTGVSNNATLNNVYLYDGAQRLTDSASVLADGSITFNSNSGLFSVNGSRTVSVRADIAAGVSGQSVGVMLSSYTVAGSQPSTVALAGNNQPVANVTLASTTFNGTGNVAAQSINAGQMNTTVWTQNLTVSTRAVKLHSMTFKMIGSAPMDSLANVSLFVDGTKVGTASSFDMNGRATVDLTSSPLMLNTGSHTVDLRADIVKGSNRSFTISIENAADIRIEDRDVPNAFITSWNQTTSAYVTMLSAGLITINTGNLTINLDPAFNATQVVGGATNVEVGRFQFKAYGEDVKVLSLAVLPVLTSTTPAAAGLNNLSLYVNGGQVGSSYNWTSGNYTFSNLGGSLQIPAGQAVTVTVKADLVTTGNVNYTAGSVGVNLVAGSNNAQGMTSNNTVSTGAATGKTLSLVSGTASFGTANGFNPQTINQNTNNVKIGSFTLQSSNADSLRVTNLSVALTSAVANVALTSITNLTVKDGSTVIGTPVGNVSATNNFSTNITLPMSGAKTFDVYADIGSAANSSTTQASMTATYNGVTNTSSLTSTAPGVAMTVNTAVLASGVPAVNSTPVAQYVAPGTREFATFNVKSTNGQSVITKLTFNVVATGINSITVGGVTKGLISGATTTTVDGLNITVPNNNSGVSIKVDGVMSAVGNNAVTSGGTNLIALVGAEYTSGNTTTNITLAATSTTATLVASMPTAVKGTGGFNISSAATLAKVGTISVTANASGDINLTALPVNIGMPAGATISAVELKEGNSLIAGSCTPVANTVCTFSTVNRVTAGLTKTFDVYATYAAATPNSGNSSVNAGPALSFLWDDTNVTAGSLTGTLVPNYGN